MDPRKLKSTLASLKEKTQSTESVSSAYRLMIVTECLQRGVIVDDDDASNVLDAVVRVAGKPLTEDLPSPLAMAVCVVSGLVAEKCADLCVDDDDDDLGGATATAAGAPPSFRLSGARVSLRAASERCARVGDDRLRAILSLDAASADVFRRSSRAIARSHHLRAAARFAPPDAPQPWRRVLDATLRLREETSSSSYERHHTADATRPLRRLARVAASKGNRPRASVWNARLAESLLSDETTTKRKNGGGHGTLETVQKAFAADEIVADDEHDDHRRRRHRESRSNQAAEAFAKVERSHLSEEAPGLYEILALRIELAKEEERVSDTTTERLTKARNRRTESSGLVASSEDDATRTAVRADLWLGNHDDAPLDEAARSLAAIVGSLSDDETRDAACDLLSTVVSRSRARALVRGRTRDSRAAAARRAARDLVAPLLEIFGERVAGTTENDGDPTPPDDSSTTSICSPSLLRLVENCARCAIELAWATEGERDDAPSASVVSTAAAALRGRERRRAARTDVARLGATSSSDRDDASARANASAAGTLRARLASVGDGTRAAEVAEAASAGDDDDDGAAPDARSGATFLAALAAWAGLHGRPWPFGSAARARSAARRARETLDRAETEDGREPRTWEWAVARMGAADAEELPGGSSERAGRLWTEVTERLERETTSATMAKEDEAFATLLRAVCLLGAARVGSRSTTDDGDEPSDGSESSATRDTRRALELLRSLSDAITADADADASPPRCPLWFAHPNALSSAVRFHLCAARRLLAESLSRAGRSDEALSFLRDAVKDAPHDYDAATALASFQLRTYLYDDDDATDDKARAKALQKVRTLLLKTAKSDSRRAEAFSLLGIWYEVVGKDAARALGCHTKALANDPTSPASGRAFLRLRANDAAAREEVCRRATAASSPDNGWAWAALGEAAASDRGDDATAATCLQCATRCRDPSSSTTDGSLRRSPNDEDPADETARVWSSLAAAYRRSGRYSAARRAYARAEAAAAARGGLSAAATCAYARVQLELGLADEAAERFANANDAAAAHGRASALSALVRRDVEEGKTGAAAVRLREAIDALSGVAADRENDFSCARKLLGDLYSFGATLPHDLFDDAADNDDDVEVRGQLSFLRKGEEAYRAALATLRSRYDDREDEEGDETEEREELRVLVAAAECDVGANLEAQARSLTAYAGDGASSSWSSSLRARIHDALRSAVQRYTESLRLHPALVPAWCGLGRASRSLSDPLLAQHCFCQALRLDRASPESWANLALLCAERGAPDRALGALDALTRVADSPITWIGRAILWEREDDDDVDRRRRAADAYRAALQVSRHPRALLGLGATERRLAAAAAEEEKGDPTRAAAVRERAEAESRARLTEYLTCTNDGKHDVGARLLGGIVSAEMSTERRSVEGGEGDVGAELWKEAKQRIASAKERYRRTKGDDDDDAVMDELVDAAESAVRSSAPATSVSPADEEPRRGALPPPRFDVLAATKRVHADPDDGVAWCDLAKALVRRAAVVSAPRDGRALAAARTAADRGTEILRERAANARALAARPGRAAARPPPPDARPLAEAHALRSWTTSAMVVDDDDETESRRRRTSSSWDLQRALILDPDNALARAGLKRLATRC